MWLRPCVSLCLSVCVCDRRSNLSIDAMRNASQVFTLEFQTPQKKLRAALPVWQRHGLWGGAGAHRHNLIIPWFGPGSPRRQQSHSQAHAWWPHAFLFLSCVSTYARKGCSGAEEAQPGKHTPLALRSPSRHLTVLEEGAARQLGRRQRRQGDGVLRAVVRRARPAVRRHVGVAVAGAAAVDLDAWVRSADASDV